MKEKPENDTNPKVPIMYSWYKSFSLRNYSQNILFKKVNKNMQFGFF